MKTKTQTKAGGINLNHNQKKATKKAPKKLELSRETVKDLKTTVKSGAQICSQMTNFGC